MNKIIIHLYVAFILLNACQSSTASESSSEEDSALTLYNHDMDSIVLVSRHPAFSGEREQEAAQNDSLLAQYIFDSYFNESDLDSVRYYFNERKTVTGEEMNTLASFFKVVPVSEVRPSNKCVTMYRDIFLFYKEGKLAGFSKICFSCQEEFFRDLSGTFFEELKKTESHVQTDIPALAKHLGKE